MPTPDEPFTTRELAKAMRVPLPLAQKTAACLRALEILEPAGMRGRAPLHSAQLLTRNLPNWRRDGGCYPPVT